MEGVECDFSHRRSLSQSRHEIYEINVNGYTFYQCRTFNCKIGSGEFYINALAYLVADYFYYKQGMQELLDNLYLLSNNDIISLCNKRNMLKLSAEKLEAIFTQDQLSVLKKFLQNL